MMGLENPLHLIFVLAVLLLLFGAKRLPEIGRGLGSGLRGFRDALSGMETSTQVEPVSGDRVPAAAVAAVADSTPAPLQF
jgi:sec-independent protein translocase protein TatA